MMEQTIRAFYAIALDPNIKQFLCNQIENMKQKCAFSVRWVKESQLHFTLRFMGNLTKEQLEELTKQNLLEQYPCFDIEFKELIAFPLHKPRIIGINIPLTTSLTTLISHLEQKLKAKGFESEERDFLPHITLGRIIKPKNKPLDLGELEESPKQTVTNISLFKSQLTPDGSIYTLIQSLPLNIKSAK